MTGKSDDPRDRECEQRVNEAQLPAIDRFSWCLTNGSRFHVNPPDVVPSQRPPLRYTWSYTEGLWLPGGSRVTRVWRGGVRGGPQHPSPACARGSRCGRPAALLTRQD